jgi:hypothetical protein
MGELSPEAQKLLNARRSAIEELRQIDGKDRTITDHDVARVASARLLVDAITMRMVSGDAIVGPGTSRMRMQWLTKRSKRRASAPSR